MPRYPYLILSIIAILLWATTRAQNGWKYSAQLNAGAHINLTCGKGQKFPGFRAFAGFSVTGVSRGHLLVHYGPSLSIYSRTIGANLNPVVGDIQIDFTNTFSIGGGWGGELAYQKLFRTIHTGDYYNISTNLRNAVILSTNLVINNHRRNQVVGSVTGSFVDFTFNYYNDGAAPFTIIPLADNFDRYWTGGGAMFFHLQQGYNRAELSFDQFTGYSFLLYEVSNLLGIKLPLYTDSTRGKSRMPNTFNTSAYHLKVFTDKNYAVDAGTVGKLETAKGYRYGIQDLIHMLLKLSLHPNHDINRYFIGITQKNVFNVKF